MPSSYDISVTEDNLDSMWYIIDEGIINIPFAESTGFKDLIAWDNAHYEAITTKFYDRDLTSNEVYQEV